MTQETRDGIPLRFKGIIIYHVSDPVRAATVFDFATGAGLAQLQTLLGHVSLGELRSAVAKLTMDECITQRRTTLTEGVVKALRTAIRCDEAAAAATDPAWGIELDVVQVAQVYIVDVDLRRQLEAVVRADLRAASEHAELAGAEKAAMARIEVQRRALAAELETQRQRVAQEAESTRLEQDLLARKIAASEPVEALRHARRTEELERALAVARLEAALEAIANEADLARRRADQALRQEILPLEQAPEIARALAGVLGGAHVALVGGDASTLLATLAPLVDHVTRALAPAATPKPGAAGAASPDGSALPDAPRGGEPDDSAR